MKKVFVIAAAILALASAPALAHGSAGGHVGGIHGGAHVGPMHGGAHFGRRDVGAGVGVGRFGVDGGIGPCGPYVYPFAALNCSGYAPYPY